MPATHGRLMDLYDTPSSPLGSPSSGNWSTTPAGSPLPRMRSLLGTPSNRVRGNSSSPTQDFSQVASLAGRKLKLKPEGIMMLEDFTKTAESVSEVKQFAQSLKITEILLAANPVASATGLSKKLENKIDVHTFRIMMSPSIAFYVKNSGADSPSGAMKALIQDHVGTWGITQEAIDKGQWTTVTSRVRLRLTDRHYEIKKVLVDAVWVSVKSEDGEVTLTDREDPLDIIKLCEALVAIVPDADLKVTLPMLGRVAFLRQVLIEVKAGTKFWKKVNELLIALRTKYDHDEVRISKAIAKVLKNDCKCYGSPNLAIFS
ncbi:hypothetical protein K438DRAFT_1993330 [Mycena galopus ATCC 62051]|nr:hypothetical protein K438DRAFT_1993330 [Mycena galopus ATCC 62051]